MKFVELFGYYDYANVAFTLHTSKFTSSNQKPQTYCSFRVLKLVMLQKISRKGAFAKGFCNFQIPIRAMNAGIPSIAVKFTRYV